MGFSTVIVIPETQSQEKKDMLRLAGARAGRGAGGALSRTPTITCAIPARLAEALAQDRTERRDLGQPVRQCRQPAGPCRNHRARDLGPDRRQGRRLHLRRGLRWARWRAWRMALQPKGVKIGAGRSRRGGALSFYTTGELEGEGDSITEGIGQGRITANLEGFTPDMSLQDPRCRGPAHRVRPAGSTRGCAWADRPA